MSNETVQMNVRALSRLGQNGALFGVGVMEVSEKFSNIMVLTADMGKPVGLSRFKARFPQQFINVGIAEQNLLGVAAGICSEGVPVVASAQAAFISMRSFEQVRQFLGYMELPVVTVGVSAGFGLTFFGNTHFAVEDVALMRTIPGMTILSPADATMAAKALVAAVEARKPTYIRCTGTPNSPIIYSSETEFVIGRAVRLREGFDVCLIASGNVTGNALSAAELLEREGYSVAVLDFHTIKPLDVEALEHCRQFKLIVTIEEHSIIGGLGSAVADHLSSYATHPYLLRLGVRDRYSVPGDYEYLLAQNRLDSVSIYQDTLEVIRRFVF